MLSSRQNDCLRPLTTSAPVEGAQRVVAPAPDVKVPVRGEVLPVDAVVLVGAAHAEGAVADVERREVEAQQPRRPMLAHAALGHLRGARGESGRGSPGRSVGRGLVGVVGDPLAADHDVGRRARPGARADTARTRAARRGTPCTGTASAPRGTRRRRWGRGAGRTSARRRGARRRRSRTRRSPAARSSRRRRRTRSAARPASTPAPAPGRRGARCCCRPPPRCDRSRRPPAPRPRRARRGGPRGRGGRCPGSRQPLAVQ
jgi:hypothetical protein